MPTKRTHPTKNELIEFRKKELLSLGYMPGIVDKAIEWAVSSAEGMARYALRADGYQYTDTELDQLAVKFLPQFLKDTEKYMRPFGHERGETKPKS